MFPSGFVDYGEHPAETIVREVKEETGLHVTDVTLLGVFQSPDDDREPGHIMFFYAARVASGSLRTDPEENDAINWFPIQAPPEIGWQLHKTFISRLQEGSIS